MAKPARNFIDQAVAYLSPMAAVKRAHARRVLAYYEAAKPDRLRKGRRETGSGNDAIQRAGSNLRMQARHLEQNYDIALGVINTLVTNVIGANGIGVEPQPRRADGSIHAEFAGELTELRRNWCLTPEVTWQHDWPSAERILARSWFRDGEVFAQSVEGLGAFLDHGTRVPFSLELLEADFVPMELQSVTPLIQQGIEINAWGRPIGYHVHRVNPLESGPIGGRGQTKRIGADRMLHLATRHRIRQLRGVSLFASVLGRFDDLKDYEESERIAAKVAASMAAFIKKGNPDLYDPESPTDMRNMKFKPGMIFDDLKPGEEIGTIDTNRPNPNLETYRGGQIKAIAAGTGPTYSSIAKTYDGTYSAQRQELVEGYVGYQTLSSEFINRISRPVYQKFVALAILSGQIRVPADVVRHSVDDAIYITPQMPWIDPKKEVEAWGMLEDRAYISGPEIIRKRGGNPHDVLDQQARWLEEKKQRDIPNNAGAGNGGGVLPAPTEPVDPNASARRDEADAQHRHAIEAMTAAAVVLAGRELPVPQVHNHLAEGTAPITIQNDVHLPAAEIHNEITVPAPVVNNHIAAPEVTVNNAVTASPISEVAIVSMPDRETTTRVDRDPQTQNITNTTQIERDV